MAARKNSHLEKISASCSSSFCEFLWRHKCADILRELLHEALLDRVIRNDVGMAKLLATSRKDGKLNRALYTHLKTKTPAAFIKLACERFFLKKCPALNEELPEPWISLFSLHCIGVAVGMPPDTFPSEEELMRALSDEQEERLLMERLSPYFPFALALEELEIFALDTEKLVDLYSKECNVLAEQNIDGLEQVAEADTHLTELLLLHRSFMKRIRRLRSSLDSIKILEGERLPELSSCLRHSGMELALMLQNRMNTVRDELFHTCMEQIPPKFDANALRALLERIIPPFLPIDRTLADKEIAALENGALGAKESPLLAAIIPALKGELEINEDELFETFPNFPYSASLVSRLRKHLYHLTEVPEAQEPEPEPQSEPEPEPELELEPGLEPAPEPEPEPKPEPELKPEPVLSPASTSAPDPFIPQTPDPQVSDDKESLTSSGDKIHLDPAVTPGPSSAKSLEDSGEASSACEPASLSEVIKAIAQDPPSLQGALLCDDTDAASLVRQLIVARESCALYWLARTLGEHSPIPAWLVKLLHLGTHYQVRMFSLNTDISSLCDMAAEHMEELDEKQKLLLVAAILRPALMMPEQSMITIATFLSSDLNERYGLKAFMDELCTSIRSGKSLDDVPHSKMTPQTRRQQEAQLKEETEKLIIHATKGKTRYQPASALKQKLFRKEGEIGKLLHACVSKKGEQRDLRSAVTQYQDERNIKALVDASIEARARESIIKDIKIALILINKWISFYDSDEKNDRSFAEMQLERLHSAMEDLKEKLEICQEGRWLIHTMELLYARKDFGSLSPAKELELWSLRLPDSTPDSRAVSEEYSLAKALHTRDFENAGAVTASLAIHTAFGGIARTQEFLDCFPEFRTEEISASVLEAHAPMLAAALPFSLDDVMDVSRRQWKEAFDTKLEEVKESLSDSYFRGAILYDQQGRINVELGEIATRYGDTPDMAAGLRELKNLANELREWNNSSLEAVKVRIGELEEKAASSREAISFLAELREDVTRNRVFSAAWDNIARLERFLLQPGELPTLNARKPTTLATARLFYDPEQSSWVGKADAASIRLWNRLCASNPSRGSTNERSFFGVATELQRWLGFVLSSKEQSEEVFSDDRPNHWRVRRYNMTINSPLPQWGSGARNRHTIAFGWNVTPTSISNLVTSGRIKEDEALTIVCCCPLTREARKEMLRRAHSWPVFPLVIDENLFHFLAAQDEASRTEKLFEVALAGSPCNPYTPEVAGAVPREMFFGRETDKNSVFAPAGSCIIYGGRQLGKSALLEQIYQEYRSENTSETMVIKYTMTVRDTCILDVVIRNCVDAGVVNVNTSHKTLSANIKKWLEEKSGRRILILLDECDSVLDEDSQRKFHDVGVLRNLMQDTSRNFKVVFTGLHSVQRFSLEPNNPLYHFGPNICIGPLSADAAYDLMTRPMKFLGLEFEDPQLVQMALNYCNYQPKLIQMFCSELVKGINMLLTRSPVHTIDKSTMLKVYDSQDLKTRIRECFTMTLALDNRYLVIGYAMALLQGEKVSIRRLQRDLRSYWPAAFAGDGGDVITLQSLLHEMEGLGLIISLGGSYRLRTPNIAELLGGAENVLLELEKFYDCPYQPVADLDELRMEEASTLVASQYNLFVDKTSRLCWISGSRALGLEKIPDDIRLITEKTSSTYRGEMKYATLSGMSVADAMQSLRRCYEKISAGGLIASISSLEFPPLMAEFMEKAEEWIGTLRTDKKYVKVVCRVAPDCLYDLIRKGAAERFSSYQMALRPWTRNSVDYWCTEKMLTGCDADSIMAETGGWPCLISSMLEKGHPQNGIKRLSPADFVPNEPGIPHIVKGLRALDGEPCPEEDISELIGIPAGMGEDEFQRCLDTLKSLYILRETPKGLVLERIAGEIICGENL